MLFLLSVILVLLSIYVWRYYENVKRYPKGPTPYPLVGNLFTMDWSRISYSLIDLSKEHGNIFTVFIPKPHVCIMDYEGVKEAFVTKGDDFLGRSPDYPENMLQSQPNGGVINSEGDNWKEQRRISIQILRDFGMGKNLMEEQVLLSMRGFMKYMKNAENLSKFDSRLPIQLYVANVINKTLYGYHYEYDNCDRIMYFVDKLTFIFEDMRQNMLVPFLQSFPFAKHLPYIGYNGCGKYEEILNELRDMVRKDMDSSLKDYDTNTEPESFTQAYVQQMSNNPMLTKSQLLDVCFDFFIAGMETTSTTLRWAMLHMANNLEVQEKIREEIVSVIGDRTPSMSDKPKLPYTSAAILELQRHANLVPLNVVHRTTRDTSVAGQSIPNNTAVWGQIHCILASSPVFETPEKFLPERFLLDDGVTPNKRTVEQMVAFSMGKRQCAGEGLARVELFIGLVSILQNYRMEPLPDVPVDMEPIQGGVLMPRIQQLKFTEL